MIERKIFTSFITFISNQSVRFLSLATCWFTPRLIPQRLMIDNRKISFYSLIWTKKRRKLSRQWLSFFQMVKAFRCSWQLLKTERINNSTTVHWLWLSLKSEEVDKKESRLGNQKRAYVKSNQSSQSVITLFYSYFFIEKEETMHVVLQTMTNCCRNWLLKNKNIKSRNRLCRWM